MVIPTEDRDIPICAVFSTDSQNSALWFNTYSRMEKTNRRHTCLTVAQTSNPDVVLLGVDQGYQHGRSLHTPRHFGMIGSVGGTVVDHCLYFIVGEPVQFLDATRK